MTRKKKSNKQLKNIFVAFWRSARTNCAYSFPQKWQIEAKTPFSDTKCAHGSRSIFRLRFPAKFSLSRFAIRRLRASSTKTGTMRDARRFIRGHLRSERGPTSEIEKPESLDRYFYQPRFGF